MTTKHDETILAIDFGDVSTGVAFGRAGLVSPIRVIPSKDFNAVIHELVKMVVHNRINKVVVGLPLTREGKETDQARKVRHFSKLLKVRLKKPIIFFDEYGTSKESLQNSIEYGVSKKGRRSIDHYSAAIILRK